MPVIPDPDEEKIASNVYVNEVKFSPMSATQQQGDQRTRTDAKLFTADPLKFGFHPWLNIQSAQWLVFRSAPTRLMSYCIIKVTKKECRQ